MFFILFRLPSIKVPQESVGPSDDWEAADSGNRVTRYNFIEYLLTSSKEYYVRTTVDKRTIQAHNPIMQYTYNQCT